MCWISCLARKQSSDSRQSRPTSPSAVKRMRGETAAEESKSEAAPEQIGFFTPNDKTDFSGVKIELLSADHVNFDTFRKSDFRAVKVKECSAVSKPKKLLKFVLDDASGTKRVPFCMKTAGIVRDRETIRLFPAFAYTILLSMRYCAVSRTVSFAGLGFQPSSFLAFVLSR